MRNNQYQEKEKGYIRVKPIKSKKFPEPSGFIDRFSGEVGLLVLKAKVKQPVAITNSIPYVESNTVIYKFYRENGEILIPGSSIKGSIRTYFEAFFGNENAMLVFGGQKSISKVFFNDVYLDSNLIEEVEIPKTFYAGKGVDRKIKLYKLKASEEYKKSGDFKMEAIKKNTEINIEINVQGLSKNAFKAFLIAMGLAEGYKFPLKIGKGKNFGYGALEYDFVSYNPLSIFNSDNKFNCEKFLKNKSEIDSFLSKYLNDEKEKSRLVSIIKKLCEGDKSD